MKTNAKMMFARTALALTLGFALMQGCVAEDAEDYDEIASEAQEEENVGSVQEELMFGNCTVSTTNGCHCDGEIDCVRRNGGSSATCGNEDGSYWSCKDTDDYCSCKLKRQQSAIE